MRVTDVSKQEILRSLKLLLLDVDGVLTDGRITYGENGAEYKTFNVKDGLGIRLLQEGGVSVGIITGRSSKAVTMRCADLGITILHQGIKEKTAVLNEVLASEAVSPIESAFVGDDLVDIPAMKQVGISFAVADATDQCKREADIVVSKRGGDGAVREVCEMILAAKRIHPFVEKE